MHLSLRSCMYRILELQTYRSSVYLDRSLQSNWSSLQLYVPNTCMPGCAGAPGPRTSAGTRLSSLERPRPAATERGRATAAHDGADMRTGSTTTSRTKASDQAHEPTTSLPGMSRRPIGLRGARRIVEAGGRRDERNCLRALRTRIAEAHPGEVRARMSRAGPHPFAQTSGPLAA